MDVHWIVPTSFYFGNLMISLFIALLFTVLLDGVLLDEARGVGREDGQARDERRACRAGEVEAQVGTIKRRAPADVVVVVVRVGPRVPPARRGGAGRRRGGRNF